MSHSKPLVVICDSLKHNDELSMTESVNGHMIRALRERAEVEWPSSGKALIDVLKRKPLAVLVTDPAFINMTRPPSPHAALFDWTRFGGNLVFCGQFSNFVRPHDFQRLCKGWGMDWERGSYHRTDFSPTPAFASTPGLPREYNAKTSHVRVPPAARVYVPADGARTQSMVFTAAQTDRTEAAVARDKCGDGTVSWVGDVNGEEDTTPIVLWLAGLPLDGPPKQSLTTFATFTIRWSPRLQSRTSAPERTVAIGRGGAPFVWHLLAVSPEAGTRSIAQLSTPATTSDDERPPKYTRGAVFTCPNTVDRLLTDELTRAGIAQSGRGLIMERGEVVAVLYETGVQAKDRVRWCAGCGIWERLDAPRYLGCSGCKVRFYCSTSCQNQDWGEFHKHVCRLLKEGKEVEAERLRAMRHFSRP